MTEEFYEPKVEGIYIDKYGVYRGSTTNRVIWVSPGGYPFYPEDVTKWFLLNLELIDDGIFPGEPTEYTVELGRLGLKPRATFVIPAEISVEIHKRLDKTHKDGKLLLAEILADYSILTEDAQMALRYITGDAKEMDYGQWKAQKKWRRNHRR